MHTKPTKTLGDDDFVLFDLPRQFALSPKDLHGQWTALQRQHHPDIHVVGTDAAQREAMQWTVRINQAYQRLKSPLARGQYLCELAGFPIGATNNTAMPAAFLMQQMAWREALEEAEDVPALEALQAEINHAHNQALAHLKQALDDDHNYPGAVLVVRQLLFLDKLVAELDDALDHAS
jgi:molecular chaperone HscB